MKIELLNVSMLSVAMNTRLDIIFWMELIRNGRHLLRLSHFFKDRRKNYSLNVKSELGKMLSEPLVCYKLDLPLSVVLHVL